MNMEFERKLTIPKEVKEMYPCAPKDAEIAAARVEEIKKIFRGEDDRLILVIGPCSADREDSVLEYMYRLQKVQSKVSDKIYIVPRLYTNKPRTTGDGYKGLLHQPDPNGKPDMFKGIVAFRQIHMKVLQETGFTCADEMLYPENHRYINDIVNYVAVGARSVEDQQHRLTASGLLIPVGMKNPIGGMMRSMLNAVHAAQGKHTFIYRGWEVHSQGNPYAHAILRGYSDIDDNIHSNYSYEDLCKLCRLYQEFDLANPAVLIDTNHANSGKDPFKQEAIAMDVLLSRKKDADVKKLVKGFMIESYLVDGCQKVDGTTFGQSITDPCLGWEKTENLIYKLADLW